ncbi:MAG: M28 family peptidase [Pseudomonadota bacterium]|nr:M28 family peptidase [Pseudomonadota bacterium]
MLNPKFSSLFRFILLLAVTTWLSAVAQPLTPLESADQPLVHHSLKVLVDPVLRQISVEDTITLPEQLSGDEVTFYLNSNLAVTDSTGNLQTQSDSSTVGVGFSAAGEMTASVNRYVLGLPASNNGRVLITYTGSIYDVAEQASPEYAQSFAETSGIVGEQGVYLNKGSTWIPDFGIDFLTFDLEVEFTDNASTWTAISQGDRNGENAWASEQPMEEVYLIAANFTEYSQQAEDVEVLAYLRSPDPNLAAKYMDATERYLKLYEPLLGDYPYSKFALIENFWETGYGMPSFTLLGQQVIRFPFILESSYPHEILHNWWGNGVYPDYESGNWSEGLTAYLADHLFQEMNGVGHEYRKEMLARYKNYVAESADFPLAEFTSRNSAATQAVGYGKTLMLWHMLRIELGDELFLEGLRKLYIDYKYKRASFTDIANLYSELSEMDLNPFFNQWVNRTGAPELSVAVEEANNNQARIMFAQTQFGDPYSLNVPVALYYEDEPEPQIYDVSLSQKLEGVMAEDYENLQAVLVDPFFDIFRQLDREETPPTIGELFGAGQIAFVLPRSERQHWALMAENFGQGVEFEILYDDEIESLPEDKSVWILGRENRFVDTVSASVMPYGVEYADTGVSLAGSEIAYTSRASVLTGRHPVDPELALGWIHIDDMIAMPGMIEKLPHYGKYSYLSFVGEEPTNDLSGIWAGSDSPLQWVNPDLTRPIQWESLPIPESIATLPPKYLPEQLLRHSTELTSADKEGRGLASDGLHKSALYIADQFRAAGLRPLGGTYLHSWHESLAGYGNIELTNVVGMIPGVNRGVNAQPVILGAHYDHLGIDFETGELHPGADDNASGVSVLIEVATKLSRGFTPQRPILFVAFTGEESGLIGSQHFVQNPPDGYSSEDIFAMINLDAVGRLEGQTLQVFGSDSAYEWPFMAQGIGFTIGVQSEFPAQTIASSDHVSFLNAGIPAIHLFSGTHLDYHRPSDTSVKLDTAGMSDVALWVEEAMVYLADRTDPLRVNLQGAETIDLSGQVGGREASLGTMPDFTYVGDGVRISGVASNSAADEAGLQAGDVLHTYNGQSLNDLQTYSNLLRQSSPGDAVQLEIERDRERLVVEAELKAR